MRASDGGYPGELEREIKTGRKGACKGELYETGRPFVKEEML